MFGTTCSSTVLTMIVAKNKLDRTRGLGNRILVDHRIERTFH